MSLYITVVTGTKVNLINPSFGQDYYLRMLVCYLTEPRYKVRIIEVKEFINQVRNNKLKIKSKDYIHLFYIDLKSLIRVRRLCKDSKIIYHVYHLDDASWSRSHMMKWNIFLWLINPYVDAYLTTSISLARKLYRRGLRTVLVEPYYSCNCGYFSLNSGLRKFYELPNEVRLLYIGRLHDKRFPLCKVVTALKNYANLFNQQLKLIVVSKSLSNNKIIKYGNLTVVLQNRYLSNSEKCKMYANSHFFLYIPRGNVAMNPPITLLESIYHMAIPIVTPYILKDVKLPKLNVIENVKDLPYKVSELCDAIINGRYPLKELVSSFSRFYNKKRFIKQLEMLHGT